MSRSGSEDETTADTKNGTKQRTTNGPTKVEPKEPQTDKRAVSLRCLICEAQATGFHFDAQSCSGAFLFFHEFSDLDFSKNFYLDNLSFDEFQPAQHFSDEPSR